MKTRFKDCTKGGRKGMALEKFYLQSEGSNLRQWIGEMFIRCGLCATEAHMLGKEYLLGMVTARCCELLEKDFTIC